MKTWKGEIIKKYKFNREEECDTYLTHVCTRMLSVERSE